MLRGTISAWVVFRQDAKSADDSNLNEMIDFVGFGPAVRAIEPGLRVDPAAVISPDLADAIIGTAERFCGHPITARSRKSGWKWRARFRQRIQ